MVQSGFCPGNSTETVLVAADIGSPSPLILLEVTAAFDSVVYILLLHGVQSTIGLSKAKKKLVHVITEQQC